MIVKLIATIFISLLSQKIYAGPFTVDGSAIYESGGNVGIGTTNPSTLLDMEGGNATLGGSAIPTLAIKSNTSGTNYAKIEMDNNIGDNLLIQKRSPGYTGTSLGIPNSGLSVFIDNSTVGNSNGMLFWVTNSTPIYFATNSTERMRIDGSGNVGIGTTSPANPLDVAGAAHASSFPTSSDARFKESIKPLGSVIEKIRRIQGVSFDWNEKYKNLGRATKGRQIGVIAQDVEKEFPELVTTWRGPDSITRIKKMTKRGPEIEELVSKWIDDYRSMDYGRFTAVLLEAIKEQQKEIEDQQKQMTDLKAKIAALEKK